MSKAELQIEVLQDMSAVSKDTRQEEAIEAGADALAFAQSLHSLYQDQGVLSEDAELDLGILENLVDAYHGELAAAALFLSEDSFGRVSEALRGTGKALTRDGEDIVPLIVRKGFERLANRVEQAKKQRQQVFQVIEQENAENA